MEISPRAIAREQALAATQKGLAKTATYFAFSAERVLDFTQDVNALAGEEILEGPFNEDDVISILEVYGRTHRPSDAYKQVEKVQALLEGKTWRTIEEELDTSAASIAKARKHAIKIISHELGILLGSSKSLGRFSLEQAQLFCKEINEAAREDIVNAPIDEKGLDELIEIYRQGNRKSSGVDQQADRLSLLLEGKRVRDIAKEENVNESTIRRMRENAALIIARSQIELLNGSVDEYIDQLVEKGFLFQAQATLFKRHTGVIDESLKNGEVQRNREVCEVIRESIDGAAKRDRAKRQQAANHPTVGQLRIIRRLVGDYKNAIDPLSRNALVSQYGEELLKSSRDHFVNAMELQQEIDRYGLVVDRALLQTLRWVLTPKYRYGV